MRDAYASDFLIPMTTVGDPLQRGIAGLSTVMNVNDIQQGAGSALQQQGVSSLSQSMAATNNSAIATQQANASASSTPTDCSQYTIGSYDWSMCIGQAAQTAVNSSLGLDGNNSWLNRGLIGLLGLLVVAGGIVFFVVKD